MPRSRKEAFKIGFLRKCAEAGLTVEETIKAAEVATDQLEKTSGNNLLDSAGNLINTAGFWGLAMPAGLATAGGLGAGYGLSRLTDIDDEDVELLKHRELVDLYRSKAEQLRSLQNA